MRLLFEDQFTSETLDKSVWVPEVRDDGCGNRELQKYRSQNVSIENNQLVITAKRTAPLVPSNKPTYTSARVQLRAPSVRNFKYGRVEVNAKLPKGFGVWPAIWMLPTDNKYGGWPRSGEIDIAEMRGQEPGKLKGTIHFGTPRHPRRKGENVLNSDEGGFAASFHEYAVEWHPDRIEWFVDGSRYLSIKSSEWKTSSQNGSVPFDQPFHLILNVAVGGNFLENPDTENDNEYPNQFPAKMKVDYVRVWQF